MAGVFADLDAGGAAEIEETAFTEMSAEEISAYIDTQQVALERTAEVTARAKIEAKIEAAQYQLMLKKYPTLLTSENLDAITAAVKTRANNLVQDELPKFDAAGKFTEGATRVVKILKNSFKDAGNFLDKKLTLTEKARVDRAAATWDKKIENAQSDVAKQAAMDGKIKAVREQYGLTEEAAERGGARSLKNSIRFRTYLKYGTIASIIGFLAYLLITETGCWQSINGTKSLKVGTWRWTDENRKYCTCGDGDDNFLLGAPQCTKPKPPESGSAWYVTCPPNTYKQCTRINGITYGWYKSTPIGLVNTLIKQSEKVGKAATQGLLYMVKWAVVIVCGLISLYLAWEGVWEKEWIYAIGVLIMIGAGTAGWIFI